MTSKHREIAFESGIEAHLLEHGGYLSGNPANFDRKRCLDPTVLIRFIQATQPKTWKTIADYHGANAETVLLDDLTRALAGQGMLQVLRHGFKCFGKLVRVAYFAPASRMNPETERLYRENRLTVTRQVHFSERDEKSLDLVLAINGLPVLTAELKNHLTRQTVHDAMGQYRNDRDPQEQLFRFKERALVHFAVDPDQVFMTTRLEGKATFFLPFNKGHNCGAGNPPNPGGHRTAHLWEEIWQRDSLLDIVGRFLHLETVEKKVLVTRNGESTVKKIKKETMIFPRYHQLDAVRRLIGAARSHGAGRQYLVQHSAGSGKSNTIGWLAHRLSSLHDADDGKVFDTVIVITDRRVLDKQLQDTIYQFEHKQGVVQKIDENTEQLVKALAGGTPIIITTLQKFPFILQTLDRLRKQKSEVQIDTAGRRFAVIVDEAHSSQTGEQAAELKGILNDAELRQKARELAADEEVEDSADEAMLLTMLKRGRQPNISFFAFTATPKHKTLKIFNEPGPDGRPPFHHYSMRQAIEENFIHDVLKHYVTYKTYFGLVQAAETDPLVEKKKAAKALARFMSLHPTNIAQKTEVMVEHFRGVTRHKVGGRAKAMVVTDSRLHAVRYKQSFDAYIAKKGYTDIKTLVAFSGTVNDPDVPDKSYTEEGMNGIKERELPEKFESEEYQVLLVAEKYQTGFDQPLLHTMYVDKRLDGVQAVQTLSRLNRTCPGKEDTFVLDFRNEAENIYSAFKPYYEHTHAAEATSPQKLYELKSKLDGAFVYHQNEVDEFCTVYFSLADGESARGHAQLNRWLDEAVERYKALEEEYQDDFKGWLVSFRNLYGFLSQIIPYQDSSLEKLYTYGRFLFTKLPRDRSGAVDLGDEVQLKFYRLQKISEGRIALNVGEVEALYGPDEVGSRRSHDEQVPLSTLIQVLNERFGTDFKPADQLFFDQIEAEAVDREEIRQAARVNTIDDFRLVFERELDGLFIDRMEGNDDIFRRVMEDEKFRSVAAAYLIEKVYHQVRRESVTPAL